jgi:hypothetical protein
VIDFRYHLISIVAVLLALSIGIVMGTGVLGGPLLEDLKDRVEEVRAQNSELRGDINDLQSRISDQQRFAEEAGAYLLPQRLSGEQVVVFEFENVAGGLVDEVRDEVEKAGAEVAATITIGERFSLSDQLDADQLALIIKSSSSEPDDLREEAATAIGSRSAVLAAPGTPATSARLRLETLLDDLEEQDFISVGRAEEGVTVPPGASFLVLGGGDPLPPSEPDLFALNLSTSLARGGAGVLAAETTASAWEMIPTILDDSTAGESVATVGGADKVEGRIAVVLGLRQAIDGTVGHYGAGDGADSALPMPRGSS